MAFKKQEAHPFLSQLASPLILVVSQQFNDSFLVGSSSSCKHNPSSGQRGALPNDFLDEGSDGFGLLREISLSAGRTRRKLTSLNDMAFVHANGNPYLSAPISHGVNFRQHR
jgi:hypothetical protein